MNRSGFNQSKYVMLTRKRLRLEEGGKRSLHIIRLVDSSSPAILRAHSIDNGIGPKSALRCTCPLITASEGKELARMDVSTLIRSMIATISCMMMQ